MGRITTSLREGYVKLTPPTFSSLFFFHTIYASGKSNSKFQIQLTSIPLCKTLIVLELGLGLHQRVAHCVVGGGGKGILRGAPPSPFYPRGVWEEAQCTHIRTYRLHAHRAATHPTHPATSILPAAGNWPTSA